MAQAWNAAQSVIYQSILSITSVTGNASLIATLVNSSTVPAAGYNYVRIGSTVTGRQGSIYMTADDAGAPFLRVYDGVTQYSGGTLGTNWGDFTTLKAQLGLLSGITDPVYGNLSGYGLYTQNLYATGNPNKRKSFGRKWLEWKYILGHSVSFIKEGRTA